MLRENLIFKYSLIISAAIHIGGFGLFKGNSHFLQNGLTNVKDSVVVYEIGWIENPVVQGKIIKEDSMQNESVELKTLQDKECVPSFPSQEGSSGYASENSGGLTDEYLLEVRRRIESARFYPFEAKRRLISGSVMVSFDIDRDGISKNIYIVKSSGFSILDNTAKEIILKANPLPRPFMLRSKPGSKKGRGLPKLPSESSSSHYIQITIVFEL